MWCCPSAKAASSYVHSFSQYWRVTDKRTDRNTIANTARSSEARCKTRMLQQKVHWLFRTLLSNLFDRHTRKNKRTQIFYSYHFLGTFLGSGGSRLKILGRLAQGSGGTKANRVVFVV